MENNLQPDKHIQFSKENKLIMRCKSFYILSTLVIFSCKKNEEKKELPNYDCSNLISQFKSHSTQYISNGCENNVNEIPGSHSTVYVEFIDLNSKKICTGVAISEHYILTAAHCFYSNNDNTNKEIPVRNIKVISNSNAQNDNDLNIKKTGVLQSVIHPMYRNDLRNSKKFIPLGDIAIIKTKLPLKDLNVTPIKIAKNYKEGEKVLSIGYGQIAENNNESVGLKRWTLSTLGKAKRNSDFENLDIQRYKSAASKGQINLFHTSSIQDSFLLLNRDHPYEGQTCEGDSGGPQFVNRKNQPVLISITQGAHPKLIDLSKLEENSDNCILFGSSSNTYVAAYSNWINSILEQNNEKIEYVENY